MLLRGSQTAASGLRAGRSVSPRVVVDTTSRRVGSQPSSSSRTGVKVAAAQVLSTETAQREARKESYDVYVHEPVPLAQGEEKHVISVMVSDESGLINRVAGLFARRGANIESLAVGLTKDKALFTIVVNGSSVYIATLCKNLSKLVNVKFVEDLTSTWRVEREMCLFKVSVSAGPQRTEVMQIAEIFRAKINDVSDSTISLLVAGDPGKLAALESQLFRYGITELVRSGRVALRRGELLNSQHVDAEGLHHTGLYHPRSAAAIAAAAGAVTAPLAAAPPPPAPISAAEAAANAAAARANGYVAKSPKANGYVPNDVIDPTPFGSMRSTNDATLDARLPKGMDERTWSVDGAEEELARAEAEDPDAPDTAADVYVVERSDLQGVWQVQSILDPVFSDDLGQYEVHTLSIEVDNTPGVLNQVTGCFARRGYNIQSLAVGPSEKPGCSRITTVVPGSEESIKKLFKQLSKLVYVQSLIDLTHMPMQQRELMLIKVRCTPAQRSEIRNLEQIFRASILDVSPTTVIIQMMGKATKLKALTDLLEPYGILEIARTGVIALKRDSGVDSEYLKRMATQKVW
ncbi:hypothetical protein FOA52_013889 [Chlamydomonas sp. UWO 241]|nr:hypothetical protein FOA52_013889 [Chlamydomonas sp. UWO 241]